MLISKKTNQFLAIVKYGSITKAAEKINITPSALSQGLNELEYMIGRQLLNKTKNGMSLTNVGKYLHEQIYPHATALGEIFQNIRINSKNKNIVVKMDGIYYPAFQNKIPKIFSLIPKCTVSCVCEVVHNIKHEIKNGFSDIIISSIDIDLKNEDINKVTLNKEKVGIIIKKDTFDRHFDSKSLFKNEMLIQTASTIEHSSFINLRKRLENQGFSFKINPMEVIDAILMINEGLGFSFATQEFSKNNCLSKDVVFIDDVFDFDLHLKRNLYFLKKSTSDITKLISLIKQNT